MGVRNGCGAPQIGQARAAALPRSKSVLLSRTPYIETKSALRRSIVAESVMPSKNERVELEMKIIETRLQARKSNDATRKRLDALAAVLEQKLREMDNK
jgi:hypothetical protein